MQKIVGVVYLILPVLLFAQAPTQQSVKANIEQLAAGFPQERIYIQYDKPAYSPGETIWYKAYLMSGIDRSAISTNLYVDLTDADGNVLIHAVAPVTEASAHGNFDLPENYSGKSIHVRAYTKWMLNFDSAFLYDKDIHIIQTKPSQVKAALPANKPDLRFFPEGGECIAGLNNKIAFKAVYPNGKPCNVKGVVVNAKGETVAEIKSIHDGMGFFYMEPQRVETLTAKWKDDQGTSYQTTLPAIKESGVTLEVKTDNGQRGFLIKRSKNVPSNLLQVHVVATMQQQLVYMAAVKLEATSITGGSIPVTNLPSGILQITLFDSDWVAVAERITYINNEDYFFEPEVGFSALGTGKRGKNTLVINVPDSIESNLSVTVTDAGLGLDSSENIITRLMLTGDLKGPVYHPGYYFTGNSDSLQQHLDLVMLTNGWRRIKWDDVVAGKMPAIKYPNDTSYFALTGKVYGASAQNLRESALLLLILEQKKDTSRQAVQTFLKPDGTFEEPNLILFDTTKIYYSLAGSNNLSGSSEVTFNGIFPSPRKIYFDKDGALYFSDSATENRNRYFAEEQARIAKLMEGTTLAGVTVQAKTKSPMQLLDEKYATGLFSGGDAVQFDVQGDPSGAAAMSVFTYLQGRVAGLQIMGGAGPGGVPSISWRGGMPQFYLDEMPVDASQLSNISMANVGYIKVFRPPFFGSMGGGANGAIAVYTQKGGSNTNTRPGKGIPYKMVIGYTPQKEFYSPNYGTFDQRNDFEDVRSTLYWNPLILTTIENHIIKIPFYNNDITSGFRVIVEGVSKDGRITHIEKVIE